MVEWGGCPSLRVLKAGAFDFDSRERRTSVTDPNSAFDQLRLSSGTAIAAEGFSLLIALNYS